MAEARLLRYRRGLPEAGAPITQAPLMDQKLPRGMLVGTVVGRGVEIATGQTRIAPGDRALVFATPKRVGDVETLFRANGQKG